MPRGALGEDDVKFPANNGRSIAEHLIEQRDDLAHEVVRVG